MKLEDEIKEQMTSARKEAQDIRNKLIEVLNNREMIASLIALHSVRHDCIKEARITIGKTAFGLDFLNTTLKSLEDTFND